MAADWRSIVIGGKHVHNSILRPRVAKADKQGNKMYSKTGDVIAEYATLAQASQLQVIDWATEQSTLNELEKTTKETFNEVKTLLRQSPGAAVIYHNQSDRCSLMDFNHYHILIARDTGKDWDKDYRWRRIRDACKGMGEKNKSVYCSSQRVRNLPALVAYLCRPPRLWYGTRSRTIADLRLAAISQGGSAPQFDPSSLEPESIDVLLGISGKGEEDNWLPIDLITSEDFPANGGTKRQRVDEWASDNLDMPAPKQSKREDAGKKDYLPKLIDICLWIMTICQTTDRGLLRMRAERALAAGNTEAGNWLARIKNINYSTKVNHIYNTAATEYRHLISQKPFEELLYQCWYTCTNNMMDNLISLSSSIDLITEWISHNGWSMDRFMKDTFQVMSGQGGKQNCIFIYGASNAGKSVLYAHPWETIMQSVGRIIQMNTTNAFTFEGCINRRLISIEECSIAPAHVEECKKIMGGEICQVNIKNVKEGGQVMPTPVIATSNQAPAYMVLEHAQAIQNRLRCYHCCRAFDELQDYAGSAIDPRAWVLFYEIWRYHGGRYERLFVEGDLEMFCESIDQKSRPAKPAQATSLYSNNTTPAYPGKAVVGSIDGLDVVDPFLLTPAQLNKFLPNWRHHELTYDNCILMYESFNCWARYSNCWLGSKYQVAYIDGLSLTAQDEDWESGAASFLNTLASFPEQGEEHACSVFDQPGSPSICSTHM